VQSRATFDFVIVVRAKHFGSVFWFGCSPQQKRHVAAPPPAGVRRRMERNRQKLVGRDKGSLTEQQTKGTATTTIQIRGKQNTNRTTQRIDLLHWRCALPSHEWVPSAQLPPTRTQHDGTWYGMPGCVWPGGVSPPAVSLPGFWWKLTLSWPNPGQSDFQFKPAEKRTW